jgi:signal transduction histidine kinase
LRTLVPPNLPHEFFTPLTGIIGLLEILRSDPSAFTPAEIADIHTDMYQSALRLHRTLRNYLLILDLQTPSPTPPSLLSPGEVEEQIRRGVREALRHYEREDDVTIDLKPCALTIKPDDLSRIVEELVDNACKFSRHKTPVRVELAADGRLTITDQGRGMTEEETGRIGVFQQFERKKQEQQGLGLGLVLVQKLASLYNVKFLLTSQPGAGTKVEIVFPT